MNHSPWGQLYRHVRIKIAVIAVRHSGQPFHSLFEVQKDTDMNHCAIGVVNIE